MLSVIDLFHMLTYPFLLFAAWILHRRKREDLISSVLSLAVLLTMGNEQPSATFLTLHRARSARAGIRHLYDLGNICLLAGILLFPHRTAEAARSSSPSCAAAVALRPVAATPTG